ncbi:solute carrier family 35 member E3-like isoform X1 [Varroa destructor]|uniref:Sugar phosphate transporter domain-containing protein n=1 Tax=Varroa destructor TaxID=109461 RepID=A0A7M7M7V3_VARDE|nr:solute carrier family 35 member E3-like isoform X1 [Varroa destructor]XP_022656146.1 solute carrier family 35 member E3-like isoform X1 [Varroa destructor]XP_022656147.1 solute carrier family 35 member E3-like isoform X1 [Varroa destructor]
MKQGILGATPPKQASMLYTSVWIFVNLAVSIAIVLLNKWVYVYVGFPNITMSCTHFIITSLGLAVCRHFGIFNPVRIPFQTVVPLAVTFCGFVALTNLSLQNNAVGTFQLLKTLTMPTIMVIQTWCYAYRFSRTVVLSLVPIVFGVYLNCQFDLSFNALGSMFALSAVVITSMYQVFVGEKQKELQVSSMQLLWYQAPMSVVLLLIAALVFESPLQWLAHSWSFNDLFMVLLTGLVAFVVNLTSYWIIGNTSPMAYNVLGQLKLSLTLLGGYLLFDDPLKPVQLVGVIMTVVGCMLYTHNKVCEQRRRLTDKQDHVVFSAKKP